ncbi:CDC-like kinase 4 isoform 1, partial [Reticulomyxa filosa]
SSNSNSNSNKNSETSSSSSGNTSHTQSFNDDVRKNGSSSGDEIACAVGGPIHVLRQKEKELEKEREYEKNKKDKEKGRQTNDYSCDTKGYIIFHPNLTIMGGRFRLIRQLGKGTFSRVFEAVDEKPFMRLSPSSTDSTQDSKSHTPAHKHVKHDCQIKRAIKIIRSIYKYQVLIFVITKKKFFFIFFKNVYGRVNYCIAKMVVAAKTELAVLQKICSNDPHEESHCVHLLENGLYKGHPLLIFPLFGRSLYGFLVDNGYKGFTMRDVKTLARQIIKGVAYVHKLDIIITDLKPENIVLENDEAISHTSSNGQLYYTPKDCSIRLIDFGSAVFGRNLHHTHLIQTRHYRAPEVVYHMGWSFSADIWSIGCILIELISGKMLFNTHDSVDHLNQMSTCIGPPPEQFLNKIDDGTWDEYYTSDGRLKLAAARVSPVQCKPLREYFTKFGNDLEAKQLFDLVCHMLQWDPSARITAEQALLHPYFNASTSP